MKNGDKLMFLRMFINETIMESVLSVAKAQFPKVADELDSFKDLPSKYYIWIAKQLSKEENKESIRDAVVKFDDLLKRNLIPQNLSKDIGTYKTLGDLELALDTINKTSKTQQKKEQKGSGSKTLYSSKTHLLVQPLTTEASCYYGKTTKWCISGEEAANHFASYTEKGVKFYFVIRKQQKSNVYDKIAVAVLNHDGKENVEIYNAADKNMTPEELTEFLEKESQTEIRQILNSLTDNSFVSDEEKIKALKEKINEYANQLTNAETFKQFRRQVRSILETEEPDSYSDSFNNYRLIYLGLIKLVSIKQLAWLIEPTAGVSGRSLKNVDVYKEYVNELKRRNLTVDELKAMATESFTVYSLDDFMYGNNPYVDYVEEFGTELYSIDELKSLLGFVAREFPVFKFVVTNIMLKAYAPTIGFSNNESSDEYIALRNYVLGGKERKEIKQLADLIKANDYNGIDVWFDKRKHQSSISWNAYEKLAKLINSGVDPSVELLLSTSN